MGFITSSSTQTLYAYLTQRGRVNLLFSSATASTVAYFSLHDDDINYRVSANNGINTNKLPRGFVPDITGDDDDCIKSVAQAHVVDESNYLIWGGTPPPTPGGGGGTGGGGTGGGGTGGGGTGGGGGEPPPLVLTPTADFTASTLSGFKPLTVQFTDISTNMDPNSPTAVSWEWDFNNDGNVDNTTKNPPPYIYTTSGVYGVKLTTSNEFGQDTKIKTSYITVTDPPIRPLQLELVNSTNLIGANTNPNAAVFAHNQRTNTTFARQQFSLNHNNTLKFKLSLVDSTQTNITQDEFNTASFRIICETYVDTAWISLINLPLGNNSSGSFNSVGDIITTRFGPPGNPANPIDGSAFQFFINQSYINANTTGAVGQILTKPIEFKIKIESTSPNLTIVTGKDTYDYKGTVQGKKTA